MQNKLCYFFISLLMGLSSFAAIIPNSIPVPIERILSDDYARILLDMRKITTRHDTVNFLSETFAEELLVFFDHYKDTEMSLPGEAKKTMSASQLGKLFQMHPDLMDIFEEYVEAYPVEKLRGAKPLMGKRWAKRIRTFINEKTGLRDDFLNYANPYQPLELISKSGEEGYSELLFYANVDRVDHNNKFIEADNLMEISMDFYSDAEEEIFTNVYDRDLIPVAEVLAKQCRAGKLKGIAMDGGVVTAAKAGSGVHGSRPDVLKFIKIIEDAGCKVRLIDAVNLNHKKLAAKDANIKSKAMLMASMANETRSGQAPKGDLEFEHYNLINSKHAKPNANQLSIFVGQYPALVGKHNLTLDTAPQYNMRGAQFPMDGGFKFYGPKDLETGKVTETYMLFTPKGAMKDPMRNFYGKAIWENARQMVELYKQGKPVNITGFGPTDEFRLALPSFAYSSLTHVETVQDVAIWIFEQTGKVLHIYGVGDRPFMMQEWSGFGILDGTYRTTVLVELDGVEHKFKVYLDDHENKVRKALGTKFEEFRKYLKVSSRKHFGDFHEKHIINGVEKSLKFTRKVHMKGMAFFDFVIHGTSLNPSQNAISSREQIIATNGDRKLVRKMWAVVMALWNQSKTTYKKEKKIRNGYWQRKVTAAQERKIWKRALEQKKIHKGKSCQSLFAEPTDSVRAQIEALGPLVLKTIK